MLQLEELRLSAWIVHSCYRLHLTLIHQMACCDQSECRIAVKAFQIPYFCHLLFSVQYLHFVCRVIYCSMITTMILDLKLNYGIAHTHFERKNMEFAMFSRLFYTRTVHRKPSSKATLKCSQLNITQLCVNC